MLLTLIAASAQAQKVDKKKFELAERRARNAAKVLSDVTALPQSEGIPVELLTKAKAIAVFPDADKITMLFMKMMKGWGLVSRRIAAGWTQPGFYGFAVIDRGWTKAKGGSPGIVMLFMNDEILKGFEKRGVQLEGVAGPVGSIPAEDEKKIGGAGIIIYAFSEGKLRGISVEDDLSTESGIGEDNHLNEAVYGLKGRELFAGKTPEGREIPAALTEYHKVLNTLPKQGS